MKKKYCQLMITFYAALTLLNTGISFEHFNFHFLLNVPILLPRLSSLTIDFDSAGYQLFDQIYGKEFNTVGGRGSVEITLFVDFSICNF